MQDERPRWHALACLTLVVASVALHHRSLSLGFLADDYDLLGATFAQRFSLLDVFPAGGGVHFTPLVMASLWAERHLGGPTLHHASNLAVHVACVLCLYASLVRVRVGLGPSLVLAMLFSVHPANVTDICWISGRTDLLCAAGYFTGLFAFVRFVESRRRAWLLLALLGQCWALCSKEMGVTFAAEAAALVWLLTLHGVVPPAALRSGDALRGLAALVVVTAAYLAFTTLSFGGAAAWAHHIDARSVVRSLSGFAAVTLAPIPQHLLMDVNRRFPSAGIAIVALAAVAAVVGAVFLRRRDGVLRRGAAVGLIGSSPVCRS